MSNGLRAHYAGRVAHIHWHTQLAFIKECGVRSEEAEKGIPESVAWVKKMLSAGMDDGRVWDSIPKCVMMVPVSHYLRQEVAYEAPIELADEGKELSKAVLGSRLKKVIDAWPKVQELLEVSRMDAVVFTETIFRKEQICLYIDDEHTGLWFPCTKESQERLLSDLGCSEFAGDVTNDPKEWGDWRILPNDYDLIIAAAEEISKRNPPIVSGSYPETALGNTLDELQATKDRVAELENQLAEAEVKPSNVDLGNRVKGDTYARLQRAISAFPEMYPGYRQHPPKLDSDVRPWLNDTKIASSTRESHVFGSIIAEHFKL